MALLEETRRKIEEQTKADLVKKLQFQIEEGRSAERLLLNADWKKLSDRVKEQIELTRNNVIQNYNSIVEDAYTQEKIFSAFIKIRELNLEIKDFESFISLPQKTANVGIEASKQLRGIGDKNA